MVQTKLGAERNPWVEYMKLCSEYYKSGHRTPPPIRRENDEQKPVNPSLGEGNNEKDEKNVTYIGRRKRRNRRNKTKSPRL